ncbi:Trem-like transcript 2 protein, partial [Aptenodytes patagonicus]
MELRVLLLLPLCFPGLQAKTPAAKERRLEGSTLYIQCPYTAQTNSQQQKAWCHVRENRWKPLVETTEPSQYPYGTNATNGKVTIEDNPTHRTVSITMTNLQVEDSGTYCCASRSYGNRYLPLKTISLNVFKELHKLELDSLSVQCPYSTLGYSTGTKAWCREGQTGCKLVVSTDYSSTWHNSKAMAHRTLIQDDTQQRTVTITMQKLQVQDTGTYFCVLYRSSRLTLIMEVRLSVSKILAGTTLSGTAGTNQTIPSGNTPAPSSNVNTFILLAGILSILFILALISMITLCVRRCKQLKKRGTRQAENIYDKPEDIAQLDSTERMEDPKDDSKDLKYVTLNFKSRLSPEDPLYCNVEPSQTHRKPKDENVEYAIIALK